MPRTPHSFTEPTSPPGYGNAPLPSPQYRVAGWSPSPPTNYGLASELLYEQNSASTRGPNVPYYSQTHAAPASPTSSCSSQPRSEGSQSSWCLRSPHSSHSSVSSRASDCSDSYVSGDLPLQPYGPSLNPSLAPLSAAAYRLRQPPPLLSMSSGRPAAPHAPAVVLGQPFFIPPGPAVVPLRVGAWTMQVPCGACVADVLNHMHAFLSVSCDGGVMSRMDILCSHAARAGGPAGSEPWFCGVAMGSHGWEVVVRLLPC